MAGHSKWANIQHRKGRQDKARSKLFSKLSKDIAIAAKMGGPDPDMNPRLRLAINNAKGQSMPKDNIQRAVDKGAGGDGALVVLLHVEVESDAGEQVALAVVLVVFLEVGQLLLDLGIFACFDFHGRILP